MAIYARVSTGEQTPGFTHEVPEIECYACFGNCECSSALSGVALSKPRRVIAERAQLSERSHASPLNPQPTRAAVLGKTIGFERPISASMDELLGVVLVECRI